MQLGGGDFDHLFYFASIKLSHVECNYTTTEQ